MLSLQTCTARGATVPLLLCVVLTASATATSSWCVAPQCTSLELTAEFITVDYDWTDSGFANRQAAIDQRAFIPNNNLITGINFYGNTTFLCVPRWRSGVPSTLNTLAFNDTTGLPYLKPFPNWAWQQKLSYVQAVYVDRKRGNMWIIDTGRENFYNNNSNTIQNRAASLIVLRLGTLDVLHNITFSDALFHYNSSFLNDVRVDPSGTRAYMTDTNLAGHGAVVVVDVTTGYTRRIANPTTHIQPGYVVNVGGTQYPSIQAPSDGIALSPDGASLYYSVITGSHLFRVPTDMLFDAAVTDGAILNATTILFDKGTSSDGMDAVDMTSPHDVSGESPVIAAIYGGFVNDSIVSLSFLEDATRVDADGPSSGDVNVARTLSESRLRMEWVDTIVADANPDDADSVVVYFTSNRLPQYVDWTMDFSGKSGSNMRVWKLVMPRAQPRATRGSSGQGTDAPTWTIVVMATLAALLGAVIALYWVVRRAKVKLTLESAPLIQERK